LKRVGQNATGVPVDKAASLADQTAAITAPLPILVMETLSDNDGHAVNLVFHCLDIGCNVFNPSFISIDNASQSQIWSQDFTQAGPFVSVSPFAIAPDNTIYAVGTYVLSRQPVGGLITKARTKLFALDGATGSQKFALELPSVSQEEILFDRDNIKIQDDIFETGAGIGPISVMPDGSLQALLWTYHRMETQIQSNGLPSGSPGSNCNVGQLACTTAISNHQKLELLTVAAGGSLFTQQMQTYDFDISGCIACVDPGSVTGFFPGQAIPDGFGGTLASWTKTSGTLNSSNTPPSQFLSSIGGPGGTFDIEMGTAFVPAFLGEGGTLVLGENNVVFAGNGPVVGVFDFVAKTQRWASQPTGGQFFPIVATADGGLLAEKTSSRFGAIDAALFFDVSGAGTLFPTTTGASYFSDNTLLGFLNGSVALLSTPMPITTDPDNIWPVSAGNEFQQRAPTRPQITSLSPSRALIGNTIDVQLQGRQLNKIVSIDAGTGITATINPKTTSNSHLSVTLAMDETTTSGIHKLIATLNNGNAIESKQSFFVQVPTQLKLLSAGVSSALATATANGCPVEFLDPNSRGPFGMKLALKYQVLDQQSQTGEPIIATMPLREDLLNLTVDGQLTDPHSVFDQRVTFSGATDADGSFVDDPVGACGPVMFTNATFTQRLFIPLSTKISPTVRTNTYSETGQQRCGMMTNGDDIKVDIGCN
jgi:hypothetical protein